MNILPPVLAASFTKQLNKNIDRNSGMLYNNNVGDSFTFGSARNRRYGKSLENELKTTKNQENSIDIANQDFLNKNKKKYNINERSRLFSKNLLLDSVSDSKEYLAYKFGVVEPNSLKLSKQIDNEISSKVVISQIPVLEDDKIIFMANTEFSKSNGHINEVWFSKN